MLTAVATPTVRAFQPADVLAVLNRDGRQVPDSALIEQANLGPAFTFTVDDVPLACAGVVILWPGVGSAWTMISQPMLDYPLWLTRTVRRMLYQIIEQHDLHRVETVALMDSVANQRWLEALGFVREGGIAHGYLSDKRSAMRFELVKGVD